MYNLVLIILITFTASFICNGVYLASRDQMFLFPFRMWLKTWVRQHFMKPIFECIICMASVWGVPSIIVLYHIAGHDYSWFELVTCVIALMPANFITYRLVDFE